MQASHIPTTGLRFSRISFSRDCFEFFAAFGTFYAYFAFTLWNPAPLTAMRTLLNHIVQSCFYPPRIKTLNYFIPDNEGRYSSYVHVPQFLLRFHVLLNIFFYIFVAFFSKKLLGCAAMGSHGACIHSNCLHHNPFPAMPSIIKKFFHDFPCVRIFFTQFFQYVRIAVYVRVFQVIIHKPNCPFHVGFLHALQAQNKPLRVL